jgi:apolipoprotein N-acyltransferase
VTISTDAIAAFRETAGTGAPGRRLRRLAALVGRSTGWRRIVLALALGALAVLALPPLYVLPALIPAFTGLVWLLDGARNWRVALGIGFWFGLGHFSAGLYWVANALLTKPEQFGLVAPIAPVALALILTPNTAAACAVARLSRHAGVGRVITLAAAWTIFEWVRSWLFTGFPWNPIGSVWAFSDAMLQPASIVGVYGLGLVTVAAAAMPSVLARPALGPWHQWRPVLASFVVLGLCFAFGAARLASIGDVGIADNIRLRLVQGNIPQNLKWRPELVDAHLLTQARLSATPATPPPKLVIWSEASAPLFLANDRQRLSMISEFTPRGGLTLVGTLRTSPPGSDPWHVWNSMLAINDQGHVIDFYDKSHLVPFGEFMPFRDVLGFGSLAAGSTDLSTGPGRRTLHLPGVPPVGPLICYEVIFSGDVVDPRERPKWLLNLTNDGWYGASAGPYQHLVAARLRAVEEGLPVIRVANTGISAIIDPLGRVIAELGLEKQGILDGWLPQPLSQSTIFARTGVWAILTLALIIGGIGWAVSRRK